jgi:transcriptional regulator with XRE-family HTH domain
VLSEEEARFYAEIGGRVRALRLARGLSLAQLGAVIGRTRQAVAQLEAGRLRLRAYELARLAPALGATPAELLGG